MLFQCGRAAGAASVPHDAKVRGRYGNSCPVKRSGQEVGKPRSSLGGQLRSKAYCGHFFSSVEVVLVVLEAPSFIDDLKLRMPSPSPLPSSPNFLGPKMSRAMNTIT